MRQKKLSPLSKPFIYLSDEASNNQSPISHRSRNTKKTTKSIEVKRQNLQRMYLQHFEKYSIIKLKQKQKSVIVRGSRITSKLSQQDSSQMYLKVRDLQSISSNDLTINLHKQAYPMIPQFSIQFQKDLGEYKLTYQKDTICSINQINQKNVIFKHKIIKRLQFHGINMFKVYLDPFGVPLQQNQYTTDSGVLYLAKLEQGAMKQVLLKMFFLYCMLKRNGVQLLEILTEPLIYAWEKDNSADYPETKPNQIAFLFEDNVPLKSIFQLQLDQMQPFDESILQRIIIDLTKFLSVLEESEQFVILDLSLENIYFAKRDNCFKILPRNNLFQLSNDDKQSSDYERFLSEKFRPNYEKLPLNYKKLVRSSFFTIVSQLQTLKTDTEVFSDEVFLDNQIFQMQLDKSPLSQILLMFVQSELMTFTQLLQHLQKLNPISTINLESGSITNTPVRKQEMIKQNKTVTLVRKSTRFFEVAAGDSRVEDIKNKLNIANANCLVFQFQAAIDIYLNCKDEVKELFGYDSTEYSMLMNKLWKLLVQVNDIDNLVIISKEYDLITPRQSGISISEKLQKIYDRFVLAKILHRGSRYPQAKEAYIRVIQLYESALGKICKELVVVINEFLPLLNQMNDPQYKTYSEYIIYLIGKLNQIQAPVDKRQVFLAYYNYGKLFNQIGNLEKSVECMNQAEEFYAPIEGKVDELYLGFLENHLEILKKLGIQGEIFEKSGQLILYLDKHLIIYEDRFINYIFDHANLIAQQNQSEAYDFLNTYLGHIVQQQGLKTAQTGRVLMYYGIFCHKFGYVLMKPISIDSRILQQFEPINTNLAQTWIIERM